MPLPTDQAPHIPARPSQFFAVVWRHQCVSDEHGGCQPLTTCGHKTLAQAIAEAEKHVASQARCSRFGKWRNQEYAPMPGVEIKEIRWTRGRCEVASIKNADINTRMRKAWMDNIHPEHPDRRRDD